MVGVYHLTEVDDILSHMDSALNVIARNVRAWMESPARLLDRISGGRITPNQVTLVSLLGHFAVVWALWSTHPVLAALLLAFFGIMDTLDGALARLQKRATLTGMLYDAVSDRVKEIMVYVGLVLFINQEGLLLSPTHFGMYDFYTSTANVSSWLIVAVCGLSITVSYIKAKGEMALSSTGKYDAQKLNKVFASGLARYEVRMALIIFGLLTGTVLLMLHILLVVLVVTALQRLRRVSEALKHV